MSDASTRHFSPRTLYLLWTVPIVLVMGLVPVSLARFERCGIDRCLGEAVGFASPVTQTAIIASVVAGILLFAALAITPWLRPIWLRLAIGLAASLALVALWIWEILFYR